MANKEVHIGDDWYLGENNNGDLIFYNFRKDEVVKAIDVITGAEDKKGNSINNLSSIQAYRNKSAYWQSNYNIKGTIFDNKGYLWTWDENKGLLLKTDSPHDSNWTVVNNSISGRQSDRGFHITAQGTILISQDGQITRSVDGGSSFSNIQALTNSSNEIWSYTENSSGMILASEYQNTVALWKSTDDGASWTKIADGATLSEFPSHIHKITFLPQNDWIIITGGDGVSGWYKSTDGGNNFTFVNNPLNNHQFVGVAPHPSNGNKYFLGSDNLTGLYKVRDDNSGTVRIEKKLAPQAGFNQNQQGYIFSIANILDEKDKIITSSCAKASLSDDNEFVNGFFMSESEAGAIWKMIAPTSFEQPSSGSKLTMGGQGPYEKQIDLSSYRGYVAHEDVVVDLSSTQSKNYGVGYYHPQTEKIIKELSGSNSVIELPLPDKAYVKIIISRLLSTSADTNAVGIQFSTDYGNSWENTGYRYILKQTLDDGTDIGSNSTGNNYIMISSCGTTTNTQMDATSLELSISNPTSANHWGLSFKGCTPSNYKTTTLQGAGNNNNITTVNRLRIFEDTGGIGNIAEWEATIIAKDKEWF